MSIHRSGSRRASVLPVALILALLLTTMALGVSRFRSDVSRQAARMEAQAKLSDLLASASAESWWAIGHPGLGPCSQLLTNIADPSQNAASQQETIVLPLSRALASRGTRLERATARVRRWTAGPLPQGVIELTVSATAGGAHLTVVELRRVWLIPTGSGARPRVELASALAARHSEGA